ncbi:MAG TPA: hypothetical protein VK147_06120 [Candidatus Didemnitutus sp.]|nr:hypothetical protein [Candidatus Didemnitutus sp.]
MKSYDVMTQEEFDFLVMIIELTSNGEIQARVKQLNNGDFDSDLKQALNRARRIQRWVAKNNPREELRQAELVRAATGFDHFAYTDLSNDVRFRKINAFVDRLGKAYFIVDLAIAEIDVYVDAVKKRYLAKGGVDKESVIPVSAPSPFQTPLQAPLQAPVPAKVEKRRPSVAERAFVGAVRYFITAPDDIVRIIHDGTGTIEMNALSLYEAGEILGALKDHFYLDRKNGKDLQISVAGHAPLPWFGETESIESAVIAARGSKQTSREFESIRRTFGNALNRYDVR